MSPLYVDSVNYGVPSVQVGVGVLPAPASLLGVPRLLLLHSPGGPVTPSSLTSEMLTTSRSPPGTTSGGAGSWPRHGLARGLYYTGTDTDTG